MKAVALPVALLVALLLLASLGSVLLVALAYGLASLLGRWLLLGRVELTALCLVGLLAAIWFITRAVGAGLVASLSMPEPDDDDEEEHWSLGPYAEDDEDEGNVVEVRRGPPPRAQRRKDVRRR